MQQSIADKKTGQSSPLSAKVFLCRVAHIFPFFAIALVVWPVALMTLGAGRWALLTVGTTLIVDTRYPGLSTFVARRWSAGIVTRSMISDSGGLFPVDT